MSRFEESALRNSAGETTASNLPYWHPSSQFSSLIDPQHDPSMSLAGGHSQAGSLGYGMSNDNLSIQQHASMAFDVAPEQRYVDFTAMTAFPQQQLPQQQLPIMQQYNSMTKVKTPTGTKSMRRPGLAGASALINGQYCCHWTANGIACRHKFLDPKLLNDHIKAHHVRGAGSFVCHWAGCDKGNFPTANKLVRHVHSHTGYKPFPCPSCSQAFVTKDQLEKHVTTHTGAKDFECTWPGCGRSFAVKHALDGHMNSVHLKAKKHICPHCAQAFDDSSNLSKHKKQVHNPETGIKCPARHTHGCMYVDSRKDKLREHCEFERHGLETIHDPHAWNLWVQQFKCAGRKSESRRHSRASSISTTSSFMPTPHSRGSIDCSRQRCAMPVCLPCNILCNDNHPIYGALQPCDDTDCDPSDPCHDYHSMHSTLAPCHEEDCEPCMPCDDHHANHGALPPCHEDNCDPCIPCDDVHPVHVAHQACHEEACDPCDPCDDIHCDPSTRQPCVVPVPCSDSHCRSASLTPSHPSTPHGMSADPCFSYHGMPGHGNDMFDADQFQLASARLSEYMMMN